jgi:hypothetical protein
MTEKAAALNLKLKEYCLAFRERRCLESCGNFAANYRERKLR